jgi:hypothetical protein
MNVLITESLAYRKVTGFITATDVTISLGLPYVWQYFWHALGWEWSTRCRSWLRHCATNRKVAGSISDGAIDIFH